MASNIGKHELFTPLHAIDGALELLVSSSMSRLDKEAREVVELIADGSRNLRRNLGLLLDYVETMHGGEPYRAARTLDDMGHALALGGAPSTLADLMVEVDIESLSQGIKTLKDHCRLEAGPDFTNWSYAGRILAVSLGSIDVELAAGEGELASFVAHRLIERAGGELTISDGKHASVRFPAAAIDRQLCLPVT